MYNRSQQMAKPANYNEVLLSTDLSRRQIERNLTRHQNIKRQSFKITVQLVNDQGMSQKFTGHEPPKEYRYAGKSASHAE